MSITKCPGHMRSLKLNFSATVLTLGLKAKICENLRLVKRKFWGELRTRAPFDRCVGTATKYALFKAPKDFGRKGKAIQRSLHVFN